MAPVPVILRKQFVPESGTGKLGNSALYQASTDMETGAREGRPSLAWVLDSSQKIHFRPNWIRRGSEAVTIRPAVGLPIRVSGLPNTGVLVKLNDSNRNWM